MGALGYEKRPAELAELQVCAAVGQSRLMSTYDKLFAAYNLPAIEKFGGGGLSVSSVITHRDEGVPHARTVAMGPTAVSLGVTGVRTDGGRVVLEMGMGLDHAAVSGIEARRATDALYDLFTSKSPEVLQCFD